MHHLLQQEARAAVPSLAQREGGTPVPPGVGDCTHRMRVVGYVRPGSQTRTDCLQPLRAVCEHGCGHETYWRCDCTAETKCALCSERKRKLLARLIETGTTDRVGSGFTYFLTLTAPGNAPHRRWKQGKQQGPRQACHCHAGALHLAEWNPTESSCWNRLRLSLSRITEGSLTYVGAIEVQKRGALHRHVVLNVDRPLLPEEVQAAALAAGYGCVYDLQVLTNAGQVARYVSKYVTKSAGARDAVPWLADVVDKQTGEVRLMSTVATFRTWSAAQSWGYTLKGLRAVMRAQAEARARYLRELADMLAEDAGGLAPETAGHVHMTGPPT